MAEPSWLRSEIVAQVRRVTRERLADPDLAAATVARAMGLSRASLYRRLQEIGAPPIAQIVRALRLHQALALLLSGERTVSEVAADVGFGSLAQFSRSFKQAYGVSPSALRKGAEVRDGFAKLGDGTANGGGGETT